MTLLQKQLSTGLYLKTHPVLAEPLRYKIKYLSVLEFFVREYASNSRFAKAALAVYKKEFLGNSLQEYSFLCNNLSKAMNKLSALKFRGFKLFSYRYILLLDCLFICALTDEECGKSVAEVVKTAFSRRYHSKIDSLCNVLYHGGDLIKDFNVISPQIEAWKKNREYFDLTTTTVLVTANMSAGKSTLLNAIIGKSVSKAQNAACTAKRHYLYSKAFEDGFTCELDHVLDLDADYQALMDDNRNNRTDSISVGTAFRLLQPFQARICFIDTPGVNSSMDASHQDITQRAVETAKYDTLVYVLNGENIGTTDDQAYLSYIKEHSHAKRLLFVINKLDRFRREEDSIDDTVTKVRADLENVGFEEFVICPVSAYAGYLAKKALWKDPMDEEEMDELSLFRMKFKKDEFDFSRFYSIPDDVADSAKKLFQGTGQDSLVELLNKSGLLGLEYVLTH